MKVKAERDQLEDFIRISSSEKQEILVPQVT
jgi:hypothetical protein